MKKIIALLPVAILLCSCVGQHRVIRPTNTVLNPVQELSKSNITYLKRDLPVCITMPVNATNKYASYLNIAADIANVMKITLQPYTNKIFISRKERSDIDEISYAEKNGCYYIIEPTISVWEDRHTFWTGVPDKVSIAIDIFETKSGEMIDHFTIKGKSSHMAPINQKPYDLLYEPLRNVFAMLYKKIK
jgi:hypothetical protein